MDVDPQIVAVPLDDISVSNPSVHQFNPGSVAIETPNPNEKSRISFFVIAGCYLVFTITDGALRMIVLLAAYQNGFKPFEVAILFSMYEGLSIFTNIVAGIVGSKFGLKATLVAGMIFQMISIGMLMGLQFTWEHILLIAYITISQAISGIAKDLVKVSGKSMSKLVKGSEEQSNLFKIVAYLTGAKNALKGVGYFLGSFLISLGGFIASLIVMMVLIVLATHIAVFFLDKNIGKSTNPLTSLKEALRKGRNVNFLSAARLFLFGSRDIWFEIALPIFLRSELEWKYPIVGAFMAIWIIFYGVVQSTTPQVILGPLKCNPPSHKTPITWTGILGLVSIGIAISFHLALQSLNVTLVPTTVVAVIGLVLFAFFFAVNSSLHSYLILAYTNKDKVASSVGFYYMANAAGRFIGTLLSGILYQWIGLEPCLWASAIFLVISTVLASFLGPIPIENHIEEWGD